MRISRLYYKARVSELPLQRGVEGEGKEGRFLKTRGIFSGHSELDRSRLESPIESYLQRESLTGQGLKYSSKEAAACHEFPSEYLSLSLFLDGKWCTM